MLLYIYIFYEYPLYYPPSSITGADTGAWTKVITTGDGPSARFSVAGDCLDPVKGGVLVFIGGCNKSLEALDDMYYLYTGLSYLYIYLSAIFFPLLLVIFGSGN